MHCFYTVLAEVEKCMHHPRMVCKLCVAARQADNLLIAMPASHVSGTARDFGGLSRSRGSETQLICF